MLNKTSLDEAYEIAKEIKSLYINNEDLFSIKKIGNKKLNFAYGQWTLNSLKTKLLPTTENEQELRYKLRYLKHLPKFSLFCDRFEHWRVFLGVVQDRFVFCDSLYKNKYVVFKESDVAKNIISVLIK